MNPFAQPISVLPRAAASALLAGCLCLLTVLQLGTGAHALARLAAGPRAEASFSAGDDRASATALSSAADGLSSEAVLTDPRQAALVCEGAGPARPGSGPLARFHNNCRPPLLRTRAVYCDFAHLRSILHPHFALIEHASAVLC